MSMYNIIQKGFGFLSAFININFYLSSIPPFLNVIKGKLYYEETPGVYVTTCYINSLIWYIYGKMKNNNFVKISYMISGISCLIFISIYLIFEAKKYLCDSILNTFFIVTGTWAFYRALILILGKIKIVGYITILATFLLFWSPIQKLNKMVNEKNFKLIQVFSPWKYLVYSISWLIYGSFLKDIYLIITNIIGIIFSLFFIFIKMYYKNKYSPFIKRNSNSAININAEGNYESKKEEIPIKLDYDFPPQNEDKHATNGNKLTN